MVVHIIPHIAGLNSIALQYPFLVKVTSTTMVFPILQSKNTPSSIENMLTSFLNLTLQLINIVSKHPTFIILSTSIDQFDLFYFHIKSIVDLIIELAIDILVSLDISLVVNYSSCIDERIEPTTMTMQIYYSYSIGPPDITDQ